MGCSYRVYISPSLEGVPDGMCISFNLDLLQYNMGVSVCFKINLDTTSGQRV